MAKLTRIATIQVTIIDDACECLPKEAAEKNLKDIFSYCDDVQVTVQDFVIDEAEADNDDTGSN